VIGIFKNHGVVIQQTVDTTCRHMDIITHSFSFKVCVTISELKRIGTTAGCYNREKSIRIQTGSGFNNVAGISTGGYRTTRTRNSNSGGPEAGACNCSGVIKPIGISAQFPIDIWWALCARVEDKP